MSNKWLLVIAIAIVIAHYTLMYFEEVNERENNPNDDEIKKYIIRVLSAIRSMDGHEFEDFTAFIFKEIGYNVIQTPKTRDGGKDLILRNKSGDIYVEIKRYASNNLISSPHVLKLIGSTVSDGAKECIFITTSGYTQDAINLALTSKVKISLLDMDGFVDILKKCNKKRVLKYIYSM